MSKTPHKDKIVAAIDNPKMLSDKPLLEEALTLYEQWDVDLKGSDFQRAGASDRDDAPFERI